MCLKALCIRVVVALRRGKKTTLMFARVGPRVGPLEVAV